VPELQQAQTPDRNIAVVPAAGGEQRIIGGDVAYASWAGPDHVVVSRIYGSPAGVQIVSVR
jgi:hypothetical protein